MKRILLLSIAMIAMLLSVAAPLIAQETPPAPQPEPPQAAAAQPVQPAAPLPAAPQAAADSAAALEMLALYTEVPEATLAVLKSAANLAASGQWASAFKTLSEADPSNNDPWNFALRVQIALEGHVQTYMHLLFAFEDLKDGQSLEDLRMTGSEAAEPIEFSPTDIVAALEEKGAEFPAVLGKVLGDYYFEVLNAYSGQWVMSDEEVSVKVLESYEKALAGGIVDSVINFRLAEMLLKNGQGEAAAALFAAYLKDNPEDTSARFSYARSLAAAGKTADAYAEAEKLLAATVDPAGRNEIYMFLIQTAVEAGDEAATESYLSKMEADNPADNVPGLIRHLLAIRKGDQAAANAIADALLEKTNGDPNVVRSLLSSWLSEEAAGVGMEFLDRGIAKFAGIHEPLSALYFYKALLAAEIATGPQDFVAALEFLALAETEFKAFLPPESEVFSTIEEVRQSLKEAANPPAASEEDATSAASEEYEEATDQPVDTPAPTTEGEDATSAASEEYTEETPTPAPTPVPTTP